MGNNPPPEISKHSLTITGYAFYKGEDTETINTFAVLYDKNNEKYIKLPTMSVGFETRLPDDGYSYRQPGFYSVTLLKKLDLNNTKYEICIDFGHNENEYMIHTGEFVGGETE